MEPDDRDEGQPHSDEGSQDDQDRDEGLHATIVGGLIDGSSSSYRPARPVTEVVRSVNGAEISDVGAFRDTPL